MLCAPCVEIELPTILSNVKMIVQYDTELTNVKR